MSNAPTFTEEYRTRDRSDWGTGPWDSEPDKVVWVDEATGLDCLANRGPGGHWCGYVGVTAAHPWHRLDYSTHLAVPCETNDDAESPDWSSCYEHTPEAMLDVHGGITFADACADNAPDQTQAVCHLSEGGPVWWFGFDCAHCGDLSPLHAGLIPEYARSDVYRTLAYVIDETTSLAAQLAEAVAS